MENDIRSVCLTLKSHPRPVGDGQYESRRVWQNQDGTWTEKYKTFETYREAEEWMTTHE